MPITVPTIDPVVYEAMTSECVFVRREQPGVLALTGADAAEFLQGQVTNDIESLAENEGAYATLLTAKGKVRADMRILRTSPERLLVVTDAAQLPTIAETINRYRVGFAFDVIDNAGFVALLSLIGPGAEAALARVADQGEPPPAAECSSSTVSRAGHAARAIRTPLGIDLLGETVHIAPLAAALADGGVAEVSEEAAELARIETGLPRFGVDFGEQTIPEEANLNDRAVSFTKGCYVGQETVARLHYKGKPNRHLRGLALTQPVAPGTPVTGADGRELGSVGSVALSPARGPIALAVLRREAAPGDNVDVGGVSATVTEPEG